MTAPTYLELALLSMDVYEKAGDGEEPGLNAGGLGQFALGRPNGSGLGYRAQ